MSGRGNNPDALLLPLCPTLPSGPLMPSWMPLCGLALPLQIAPASFALALPTFPTLTAACRGYGGW
jgi:hypothetical protein